MTNHDDTYMRLGGFPVRSEKVRSTYTHKVRKSNGWVSKVVACVAAVL